MTTVRGDHRDLTYGVSFFTISSSPVHITAKNCSVEYKGSIKRNTHIDKKINYLIR